MRWLILSLILASSCLTGCAEGQVEPNDAGASDTAESDAESSDASDASDGTSEDDGDTQVVVDMCAVCCPGEVSCLDDSTVGTCLDDGSGYEETSCGEGDICIDGACEPEPICEPGESECFDATTRLICRPSGLQYRQENCENEQSCIDGECVDGDPNGATCTSAADCAGGKCHCGSEESCSPTPGAAFCTAECTPGGCGPDEICVESDVVDGSSYDHCVPTCEDLCTVSGLTCAALPVRDSSGSLSWSQGCHLDTIDPIGREGCSDADGCAGDTCLSDYFNTSMCTHACDGACPDGTACVDLSSGSYCTPICGSGSAAGSEPCPLDPDGSRFDITCEYRQLVDGGAKRVCVKP